MAKTGKLILKTQVNRSDIGLFVREVRIARSNAPSRKVIRSAQWGVVGTGVAAAIIVSMIRLYYLIPLCVAYIVFALVRARRKGEGAMTKALVSIPNFFEQREFAVDLRSVKETTKWNPCKSPWNTFAEVVVTKHFIFLLPALGFGPFFLRSCMDDASISKVLSLAQAAGLKVRSVAEPLASLIRNEAK